MLKGIDHLVILVSDLDQASRNYEQLGFRVVPGGRHPPAVGTHNALIALEDGAYIELIAFYQPNPNHRWWPALQQGGGLVDFALQSDALRTDTAALRSAGVAIADPVPQTRLRPDGYQLRWVFSLSLGRHRGVVPFLIQDETPREERVPRQTRHPNGASGIETLIIAVDDPAEAQRWLRQAFLLTARGVRRDDLGAAGVSLAIGGHTLEYLAPREPDAPLQQWLRLRGPSPYAALLRTTLAERRGVLDAARTLGARLALV